MKVFISWSGPQSKYIAHALRIWLQSVIQHIDPWMSELDIGAGQRWGHELMKKADKPGTKELLHSINEASRSLKERALPIAGLNEAFETWWPKLKEMLKTVPTTTTPAPPRPQAADMLEELLELVRNLARSSLSRDDLLELVRNRARSPLSRNDINLRFATAWQGAIERRKNELQEGAPPPK
jgi:hypothetical protein